MDPNETATFFITAYEGYASLGKIRKMHRCCKQDKENWLVIWNRCARRIASRGEYDEIEVTVCLGTKHAYWYVCSLAPEGMVFVGSGCMRRHTRPVTVKAAARSGAGGSRARFRLRYRAGEPPRTNNSKQRKRARSGCRWCWLPGKLAFRGTHTELRRGFAGAWVANIKIGVIKNSVHYVVDERPEAVAELIERYASLSDDCQSIMRRHTENLPIHKKVVSVGAINGARRS